MTADDLVRRYETLRQAAVAVLEAAAADPVRPYIAHQKNLDALAQVLEGGGPQATVVRELQDPDVHMLGQRDYDQGLRNGASQGFADCVAGMRRSLAGDNPNYRPARIWPSEYVRLTELKAIVVGSLLQELAARLVATGDPDAAEFAQVALEVAEELTAPTYVGLQGTGELR